LFQIQARPSGGQPWDYKVSFETAPVNYFSIFVEHAVMAPDIPKVNRTESASARIKHLQTSRCPFVNLPEIAAEGDGDRGYRRRR
jgi:hypothetical protein